MRATPGSFDVTVRVNGRDHVCQVAQSACGGPGTVAVTSLPREGDVVVVCKPYQYSGFGIVLAVLARQAPVSVRADLEQRPRNFFDVTGSGNPDLDASVSALLSDKSRSTTRPTAGGRYLDQHSGEWSAIVQGLKTGFRLFGPVASMLGGARALVRVSKIDDSVTLRSNLFRNIHAGGENRVFRDKDGLNADIEFEPEFDVRSGLKADPSLLSTLKSSKKMVPLLNRIKALKPYSRIRILAGKIARGVQLFLGDAEGKAALARISVDAESGRTTVSSAGGLVFRCSDQLQLPKRARDPWLPTSENPEPVVERSGSFNPQQPLTQALELRDAAAFDDAKAGDGIRASEGLYENSGIPGSEIRQAFFSVGPGTIVFRGGQGEELVLADGYITMSAPKGVRLASGSGFEILAGADVVVKGRDNVDVSATSGDIRVKAENNLQLVAASDARGCVVLESRAKAVPTSAEGGGTEFKSKGIVITAIDSSVFVNGKKVHADGGDEVRVVSGGTVFTRAHQVIASASDLLQFESAGTVSKSDAGDGDRDPYTVMEISNNGVGVSAQQVRLYTGGGVSMTRGKETANIQWSRPLDLRRADDKYADRKDEFMRGYRSRAQTAQGFFDSAVKGMLRFSYRDDYVASPLIQPLWGYLSRNGELPQSSAWVEKSIDGKYPWPGADAYDSGRYLEYLGEANVVYRAGSVDAVSVAPDKIQPNGNGMSSPLSFNLYPVYQRPTS